MPLENITTSESDIQENKHINDSTNNILSKVDDDDDAKIDKVIQEPVQQEPSNNSSSLPLTAENSNMPVSEDEPCENHTESDATESNCIDSSTNNNLYEVDNKADGKTGKGWGKMLNTLRSIKSGTMKFINAVKILVYDDVSLENITTSESDIQENKHINDSTNNILSKVDGDDANIDKIIQEPVQREPSNNSSSLPPKAENSEENGKSKSWNKEMELINKEQTNQNAKQLQLFKVPVCDHNMISIRFYFVALNFDYDLYVMFGHKDLGNWKQPAVHMHKYRYYSEQMANIYVGDLHCSKEIFGKKSIEYKYVLINGENYIWEHLKFESQSTSVTNRVLHISKEFLKVLDKDIIFFQVDDLYLPPKSSVISKVYANHHYNKYISVENQPKSEIYVSVFNMYVDMLEDETHNTIESSMFIKSLLSGFYHAHFMTANIQAPWIKIKDNQLITKLFKAIKKRFDHKEHELFFPSLSLLLIFYDDQNLVDLMPTNFISLVFENLSVESYNWCYSEIFDKIVQCFPEKYLRFIESALSSLLQSWFEKYNNSEAKPHVWCYALLIKHVISHESINNQEKINDSNCGLPTFINKNLLKHLGVYELIFDDLQKIKGSLLKDILLQRAIAYLMEFKYFVGALKTEAFNKHLLINMMTYHIKSSTCSDDMMNCKNGIFSKWIATEVI
ncbi:uncharacterized protein LOC136091512 isoform X2 [Hydra vulgaris]|uniref:Uncharacterized protein LOC136091512 isoform X2 n=1 Tax=Hydra vulgaris TaxID=6087 RepID=A0ABM4DL24_HYDVU